MAWTRAALVLIAVAAVAALLVSGGSSSDPRTPDPLPGLPPPFLTSAVLGGGGMSAGIDSYGDVVDLRPGPAGADLIDNPLARQEAGSVAADTGIVPQVSLAGRPALPLWRADAVHQAYLPGTNVLRTTARFGEATVTIACATGGAALGCVSASGGGERASVRFSRNFLGSAGRVHLNDRAARRIVAAETRADPRWLDTARPLGAKAPGWARRLYRRSLLALHALTDSRTGALAAGPREGWAYVWPRDAATGAIALASAGYRSEALRVARFLLGLRLGAAARFDGSGAPVPGRAAQGDAWGWVAAAARATGLPPPPGRPAWRNRADYQEKSDNDYLANALSAADGTKSEVILGLSSRRGGFLADGGLVRVAGEPSSGLDSAAAWAVRPFTRPALFPAARTTLNRLVAGSGRFGLVPSEDWPDADPWSAPTAWSAWSLAALGERHRALRLLGDLRRAETPAGLLPERVSARSGIPRSTTPLAWSQAFAILAIRQLWPAHRDAGRSGQA